MEKNKPKRVLLTGGNGFIGAHFVEHFLKNTDWQIVVVDKLSYASMGNDRLRDIKVMDDKRVERYTADLTKEITFGLKKEWGDINIVLHLAANSHVDKSIGNPIGFMQNNLDSTMNLLQYARELPNLEKFLYFSCYDGKSRALTKDGLKTYNEIKEGDEVISINQKGETEFKKVKRVIIQDYEGDMIHFKDSRIDCLVTPNHRMYFKNLNLTGHYLNYEEYNPFEYNYSKWSNLNWMEAETLFNKGINVKLPTGFKKSGKITYQNMSPKETQALFFMSGAFIGDGFNAYQEKEVKNESGYNKEEYLLNCRNKKGQFTKKDKRGTKKVTTCKSWRIYFDVPEEDKCRKELEESLNILGIKWYAENNKSGEHIYFTSKSWLKYFEQFGKGANNKHIPKWMFEYDSTILQKLFDGLIGSDGYYGEGFINYCTISTQLSEDISNLSVMLGFIPRINKRHSKSFYQGRKIEGDSYMIYFRKQLTIGKNSHKQPYKGKIWCLQVEDNKNFIVERNGKMMICGNTDEVYGTAPQGVDYAEGDRHNPGNPYSASKSGSESIVRAYANTYRLPCIITNTMNVLGERQHPEKYLPLVINKLVDGEIVHIHSNKEKTKAGTRFYIHARNVADGILYVLDNTTETLDRLDASKGVFNIVGEKELDNLELAQIIAKYVGKELNYELVDFHSSRPGHDLRYALSGKKMELLGWKPPINIEESIQKIVEWTLLKENNKWLNKNE